MFWKRGKEIPKPLGIELQIEINAVTLGRIASGNEHPTTEDMTEIWLSDNCVKLTSGIMIVNGIHGQLMYFVGANSTVFREMNFEVSIPYPRVPKDTETLEVRESDGYVLFYFEEVAIMALPIPYLVSLLTGHLVVDYKQAVKNAVGEKSDIKLEISTMYGGATVPLLTCVAADWFKYENSAAKVLVRPINGINDFPLKLGVS